MLRMLDRSDDPSRLDEVQTSLEAIFVLSIASPACPVYEVLIPDIPTFGLPKLMVNIGKYSSHMEPLGENS